MTAPVRTDELDQPVVAHMRRDFVSLHADQTVNQALAALRRQTLSEQIVYFYVVDGDGRLAGVVPTRRLLLSLPEERVADVMQRAVISVPSSATLLLACELFVMHRLLAFPVIDKDGRLVGVIDVGLFAEEVFDLSERRAADDVFQLIGVRLAQSRTTSPWAAFRRRFPWLICNIAGGLACAALAALYEGLIESVLLLALFIPVVLALSESVSVQSMTLTLQALRHERTDWGFFARAVAREFLTAALLGAASGLTVGTVTLLWRRDGPGALAVGATILLSVITACLLGVMLPIVLRALRGDPRIAAGPLVLAVADVLTLLLYFNLAGMLLR